MYSVKPRRSVQASKSLILSASILSYYGSGVSVCMYPCGFVALCVRISVAGANKVEGTMS